ncbi:MAG: hypothetical protein COW13_01675 [Candidatus Omnitrophica bacterium CG12_big_fil_rev_8_21_14_0_65_50_5]|nr:MAG: hypothetical protein COW13_01675 [Candidatus Omnitrophica bacterium CG12_big_fil_rev_8_21_14_0_65_50_5]
MKPAFSTPLATLPLNSRETLYISLHQYGLRLHLDLRIWCCGQKRGRRRPSRKGITLPQERVEEFMEGLQRAHRRLVAWNSGLAGTLTVPALNDEGEGRAKP